MSLQTWPFFLYSLSVFSVFSVALHPLERIFNIMTGWIACQTGKGLSDGDQTDSRRDNRGEQEVNQRVPVQPF